MTKLDMPRFEVYCEKKRWTARCWHRDTLIEAKGFGTPDAAVKDAARKWMETAYPGVTVDDSEGEDARTAETPVGAGSPSEEVTA